MKTSLVCDDWRPLVRNTLRDFARIEIMELHMTIHDVAVHEKDGRRWAPPPSKPQVRDGSRVTGDDGKIQYFPVISFDSREVERAFSRAVVDAVIKHDSHAFDESAERPVAREMDDAIPF